MGIKLRQLREARGLTQLELSIQSGIAQSTISQYETGYRSATLKTLQALASALACNPWDLVEGSDDLETLEDVIAVVEARLAAESMSAEKREQIQHILALLRHALMSLPGK